MHKWPQTRRCLPADIPHVSARSVPAACVISRHNPEAQLCHVTIAAAVLVCRLTSRVSGQLPERKPTLSKGKMLHVGDLLQRNSMTRSANLPPVASFLDNAPSHPQLQGASVTGASATRGVSYTGPVATLAEASPVVAAAAAVAAATATLSSGTRAVSLVQAPGSAIMAAAPTTNGLKPVAAVSPDGVHVEVPAAAPASLSDAVAAVLKQPAPAGAYVVRDIKISKLAGELDSQL